MRVFVAPTLPRPARTVLAVGVIVVLAPGQGAQKPGMLANWLTGPLAERTDAVATVTHWSDITGLDLVRLGTTADTEKIKDTAVTQPLIVANSLLAYRQLLAALDEAGVAAALDPTECPTECPAVATAGHSVGELTAASVAGALDEDAAVQLAAVRGREMADACAVEQTGMSAVLGGDPDQVLARLAELGLDPANRNGAGQVVAAGPIAALDRLATEPPERAKVKPLAVAGAFHTRYMAPAEKALRNYADKLDFADPIRPLLSNADGAPVTDGAELRDRLVAQVTRPVRWDLCQAGLRELGVRAAVELAPGGTLTGLAKRELKGVPTVALTGPEDLTRVVELVTELVTEHAGSAS